MAHTIFNECSYLSARDREIAELVARLALRAPADGALAATLGLEDAQVKQVGNLIAAFEEQLEQQSPTLSSLLAATTKSKCCT